MIGRTLVESRLAACVNIVDNMQSIYHWEGEICEGNEVILIAKTTQDKFAAAKHLIISLHSYDCPCVVSLPIADGNPPFLDWIRKEMEE